MSDSAWQRTLGQDVLAIGARDLEQNDGSLLKVRLTALLCQVHHRNRVVLLSGALSLQGWHLPILHKVYNPTRGVVYQSFVRCIILAGVAPTNPFRCIIITGVALTNSLSGASS
jgi:hypothetical protein